MQLPYGKFKGKDIDEVPSGYLRWLAENIDETRSQGRQICRAADQEYQWRSKNNAHFWE